MYSYNKFIKEEKTRVVKSLLHMFFIVVVAERVSREKKRTYISGGCFG